MQLLHHPAGHGVAAALAVQVREGAEVRVVVGVFQRIGQCLTAQLGQLGAVGGGKVRRDVQRAEMGFEQLQAVGVDGADGRALQQHPLAAQMA